jgi:hypothetical protein
MIKLPEQAMMPRLFDARVGYFTQGLTDFGTGEVQQARGCGASQRGCCCCASSTFATSAARSSAC